MGWGGEGRGCVVTGTKSCSLPMLLELQCSGDSPVSSSRVLELQDVTDPFPVCHISLVAENIL